MTLLVAAQLGIAKGWAPSVYWTGDEPRYLYYAAAFATQRSLELPVLEWQQWLARHELPIVVDGVVGFGHRHSVAHAVLFSPVADAYGLVGARWAQLAVGLLGFVGLLLLLRQSVCFGLAAGVLVFAANTLPLQPYLTLFYAEIWLFALVALAWAALGSRPITLPRATAALGACFAIPFVHLRGALVAAALFAFCATRIGRELAGARRLLAAGFAAVGGLCALAAFVVYQQAIAGSLTGTVLTPVEPSLRLFAERLGVQLFDAHHGLLVANPAWTLGFAGLVVGLAQGRRVAFEGLVLVAATVAASVWGTGSESMPARFWVIAVPALAVGLALWLGALRSWWPLLAAAPLLLLAVLNAAILVTDPNLFLANRTMSLTYDQIYRWTFEWSYLPAFLPWDPVEQPADPGGNRLLLAGAAVVLVAAIVLLALATLARRSPAARAWSLAALVVVATPFLGARMTRAPASAFEATLVAAEPGPRTLEIRLREPSRVRLVRLGEPPGWWEKRDVDRTHPEAFAIETRGVGDVAFSAPRTVPARPILAIDDRRPLEAIRVIELQPTDGTWASLPVTILR